VESVWYAASVSLSENWRTYGGPPPVDGHPTPLGVDRFGLRHVAEHYGESENGLASYVHLEIGEPKL